MQKQIVYALVLLLFVTTRIHGQWSDDFTDGDFTSNPSWVGMDSHFIVSPSTELQLFAPAVTSESYLSVGSSLAQDATWTFDLRLDFNPSGQNRAFIYLMASQYDLTQPLDGYYVLVGNTDDEVSLYRQSGSSSTEIIDGIDDWVNVSAPHLRVKVTRSSSGFWQLEADTSTGFSGYTTMGTATDNTHSTSTFFGVRCDYTSTRSDKFFFDNFSASVLPDTTGPSLDSALWFGNDSVLLFFNEPLNPSVATATSNYAVSGGVGAPNAATLQSGNQVTLAFTGGFPTNTTFDIVAQNIQDVQGNITPADTASFFVPLVLSYRDVVINEILADPTPVVGLPEAEYVEIYNASSTTISLGALVFSDASSSSALPQETLLPGGYAILCDEDDTALFTGLGNVIGLSGFPALNNSGDDLRISSNGVLIDEVNYTSSWYATAEKRGGGWSLEQVNPLTPCTGQNNWRESENLTGGTPGITNSVFSPAPDTLAPEVTAVQVIPPSEIRVQVNEPLQTSSTVGITCNITPSLGTLTFNFISATELQIITSNPIDTGVAYSFTITGLEDCTGNSQTTPYETQLGIGLEPGPFDILINEIYAAPGDGGPEEEFVELFNRSDELLSLEHLFFSDASSGISLPPVSIAPKGYAVLLSGESKGSQPYQVNDTWYFPLPGMPSLNNAGDSLRLINSLTGEEIHAVNYSESWYKDQNKSGGGYSLELVNPNAICEGASNWREPITVNHTMGEENSVYTTVQPDPIRWKSAQITGDSVFSIEATGKVDASSFSISMIRNLNPGAPNPQSGTSSRFIVNTTSAFSPGETYTLEVEGTLDCAGNTVEDAMLLLRIPQMQDIVINEVLFNPYTGSSDFVELYNRSEHAIDLADWSLDYLDTDDERSFKTLTDTSLILLPGEYIALTEDEESVVLNYPNAASERLRTIDLPTYPNDEGRVTLVSNLADTIDDFVYNEDMHFELLRDVDGVSLERIDPSRKTNDRTNWHSASEFSGFATPGYENSQYLLAASEDEVSISPETFSPDQDGVDDVVNIAFSVAESGYVANVKIYDPEGRQVRDLVNNRILGRTDVVSWDGIRDDAQKADIGIYLIFIELYNLQGDVKHFKKTCVLATRF